MNEYDVRENVCGTALLFLGYSEKERRYKKIIDIYNNDLPLPRGYRVKYTDAWCAVFVSTVAILTGNTDIIPKECSCAKMVELFQKMRRFEELDSYIPNKGDIIFYDWDDSGKGDNKGYPDHVGIVIGIYNSNELEITEGNIKNEVGIRRIKVDAKGIRGYGLPDYGKNGGTSYVNYYVKKGDTLTKIANRYNTTVKRIATDNNITDVNKIYVGQQLAITA